MSASLIMFTNKNTDVSKMHSNEGFYISYKQVKMAYSLPRVYAVFCVTDVSKITRRFYISYKQVKMTYSLPRVHAVFCGRFIITLN